MIVFNENIRISTEYMFCRLMILIINNIYLDLECVNLWLSFDCKCSRMYYVLAICMNVYMYIYVYV